MCGIAGVLGKSDRTVMERMLSVQAHRGPDDQGIEVFDHLPHDGCGMLGHRRLSIIDLSPRGHQPMSNPQQNLWVVFNGEIYNFQQARRELSAAGHRFASRTDTEVILHGYEQWSTRCVEHFTGMFAFAVLDSSSGDLLLARDRLGIKPLYYTELGSTLAFASEMKALLEVPGVPRRIDPEALRLYLSLGYVPGPRSLFDGIRKLQPGCILVRRRGVSTIHQYWSLPEETLVRETFEDQAREFADLLRTVVSDHMISDVPLGSFLSGGLDSSVVTALTAQCSGGKLDTFCVGYDRSDSRHDERSFARQVSRHVGTEHSDIVCSNDYAVEALPKIVWHMEEPVAEDLLPPYAHLCELARKKVTVAMSGEGADECLLGYRYYALEKVRRRLARVPGLLRAGMRGALNTFSDRDNLRVRALNYCLSDAGVDSFLQWRTLFPTLEARSLLGLNGQGPSVRDWDESLRAALGRVNGSSCGAGPLLDARCRLVDYILSRTDKLSMAVSLEVRVPFLDHRVFEFLARVPIEHKIRGWEGKQLLRRVAKDILPLDIAQRRKKPFGAPATDWTDRLSRAYLRKSSLAADGLMSADQIAKLIEQTRAGRSNYEKLWSLIVLELWYRQFIRRDAERSDVAMASVEASA